MYVLGLIPQGICPSQHRTALPSVIVSGLNLARDMDFQEVQEAQRVLKKLDPKRTHQGTSSNYPRLR